MQRIQVDVEMWNPLYLAEAAKGWPNVYHQFHPTVYVVQKY
jgi:hypothetical protein